MKHSIDTPHRADTAVSRIYTPPAGSKLHDVPFEGHYADYGYSLAMCTADDGTSLPENGNTAVFRIFPGGCTEPVCVTKPEPDATFAVEVLQGNGYLLRTRNNSTVTDIIDLRQGGKVTIRPGEAYLYVNNGQEDLLLVDTAVPAFRDGDDMRLDEPSSIERMRDGGIGLHPLQAAHIPVDETQPVVSLPHTFWRLVGEATMRGYTLPDDVEK